jgi:hypothetical protein
MDADDISQVIVSESLSIQIAIQVERNELFLDVFERLILYMKIYLVSIFLVSIFSTGAFPANSVVDLQKNKVVESTIQFQSGEAQLTTLNSKIGMWYLLTVRWPGRVSPVTYNLEVPAGAAVRLSIAPTGLKLHEASGKAHDCNLFSDFSNSPLNQTFSNLNYKNICDGLVFKRVRVAKPQNEDEKVKAANFIRQNSGAYGDKLVDFYKAHTEDSSVVWGASTKGENSNIHCSDNQNCPERARLSDFGKSTVIKIESGPNSLDIALKELNNRGPMLAGEWYSAAKHSGVYVSLVKSTLVTEDILKDQYLGKRINQLDEVEGRAVSYLVAFDLDKHTIGWNHGLSHPGVEWSDRNTLRKDGFAGPDGFANLSPLEVSGQLNPSYLSKLVGVMCGGFQRRHAVFKWGDFKTKNFGNYYGFLENGVVLSTLNEGLATLYTTANGSVDMKTWNESDNANVDNIKFARQNGVPLVMPDPAHPHSGSGIPGEFVYDQGLGNWSGTADTYAADGKTIIKKSQQRSARAGACISEQHGHRYLIYGYFSSANPSAMARVFQAYQCQYAMHLDMNSAGQGYLGLLNILSDKNIVETAVSEMSARNTTLNGRTWPRYVGAPNSDDFFFILAK